MTQQKRTNDDRMKLLNDHIQQAKGRTDPSKQQPKVMDYRQNNAMGVAFRISVELISSVGVGLILGWCLDTWLGTSPWLLIVFLILGASGGMLNVYRVAQRLNDVAGPTDLVHNEKNAKNDNKNAC